MLFLQMPSRSPKREGPWPIADPTSYSSWRRRHSDTNPPRRIAGCLTAAVPELCIKGGLLPTLGHCPSSHLHTAYPIRGPTAIMSNEAAVHDDLVPEQTEGFKVGEKKTIDEYQKLGKS